MSANNKKQEGAVSLFIVIFSALLITIITVGFVRLMIQDQMQATANDLSKSALDSAQAGVEDAKRAILQYYKNACKSSDTGNNLCGAINSGKCDTIQKSGLFGYGAGDSEVQIKTNEDDTKLNQAYTCVKVIFNTPDYLASLAPNDSRLIELKGTSAFDNIVIQWYSRNDFESSPDYSSGASVNLSTDTNQLPSQSQWPSLRPALMRLQLLQFNKNAGFSFDDFDKTNSNASLFLMPYSLPSLPDLDFKSDTRISGAVPQPVSCDANFKFSGYACSATIALPNPKGGSSSDREAYLRVAGIYNLQNVTFRICLGNSSSTPCDGTVKFNGVQPEVDSTGRAGDYFRRVKSRVEFVGKDLPDVNAAVDIGGNLCKVFEVGDNTYESNTGLCNPGD